jgi:DNA-binding CsgD family transcriptional regulator
MAKLTARELAVARLVAQGLTNLDVGEMLGITGLCRMSNSRPCQ